MLHPDTGNSLPSAWALLSVVDDAGRPVCMRLPMDYKSATALLYSHDKLRSYSAEIPGLTELVLDCRVDIVEDADLVDFNFSSHYVETNNEIMSAAREQLAGPEGYAYVPGTAEFSEDAEFCSIEAKLYVTESGFFWEGNYVDGKVGSLLFGVGALLQGICLTAPEEQYSHYVERLAQIAPDKLASAMFNKGFGFGGGTTAVRPLPPLEIESLAPLLQSENRYVREAAFLHLGCLEEEKPSTRDPVGKYDSRRSRQL